MIRLLPSVWILCLITVCSICTGVVARTPQVVIYLPEAADVWEKRAAELLKETWLRWAGVEGVLRIGETPRGGRAGSLMRQTAGYHGWEFSIGNTHFNQRWIPLASDTDPEEYRYRAKGFLVGICGSTPRATYQATARFIEEQMGIYWLYPGDTGWAMQQPFYWKGIHAHQTSRPGYLSRHIFGMNHAGAGEWKERNGLYARFQFHHNLYRIFTEAVFDEHPEFFPLVDGERVRPNDKLGGNNAQISFGLKAAGVYAGQQAIRYFEKNPGQMSFSLGMNDTRIFGESEEFLQGIDPTRAFRGVADYSNLVFGFMNVAAETLATRFPDRYLGCLAYFVAENVPDFPVHKQVIPYLTADRNQYWNAAFRREDEDLQRRWSQSGVRYWGTYDYFYGTAYDQVRSYRQTLQDTTVAAYHRGARGAVAEVNPRWGLAMPLPWVMTHLWWNPNQSVDELYQQFYDLAFGPAADVMRSFFEYGDQVWLRQQGRAYWLRNYFHPIQWTWWNEEDYAVQRRYLAQAKQLIDTNSPWYPRWLMVDREWRQMEAGWRYWKTLQQLIEEQRLPTEAEREQILSDLRWCGAKVEDSQWKQYSLPPWTPLALVHPLMQRRPEYPLVSVYMPQAGQLSEEERGFFEEWNRLLPHPVWSPLLSVRDEKEGDMTALQVVDDWQLWERPSSKGDIRVSARNQQKETWKIRNAIESRLYRRLAVSGDSALRIRSVYSGKVTEGSRVELQVYFCDDKGERLSGNNGRAWIYTIFPGEWNNQLLEYWVYSPKQAHSLVVQMVVVEQGDEDWSHFKTPQVERLQ